MKLDRSEVVASAQRADYDDFRKGVNWDKRDDDGRRATKTRMAADATSTRRRRRQGPVNAAIRRAGLEAAARRTTQQAADRPVPQERRRDHPPIAPVAPHDPKRKITNTPNRTQTMAPRRATRARAPTRSPARCAAMHPRRSRRRRQHDRCAARRLAAPSDSTLEAPDCIMRRLLTVSTVGEDGRGDVHAQG